MNLVRATGTIGMLTLISRILGFVRDMLMAGIVGAGFASDAFLIAFRLPNLFRALFAEGAFSAVFVPMFSRRLAAGTDANANGFAAEILSVLSAILLGLTALMMVATTPVVWLLTGGFGGEAPEKLALTAEYCRITFPYLFFISLSSLFGGILNCHNRFWVNAAAPILLNLCLITALIATHHMPDIMTARAQAIAVTVSGLLQLGWLVWAARRANIHLTPRLPRWTPAVSEFFRLIWPAALGAGAVQVNLLVSTALAARFLPQGSISYLYYADRLSQLPLGLIGIGIGTALLPAMSRFIGQGRSDLAAHQQNRAMELALFLTLPATAALVVCAWPIIRGLLQHGAFNAGDTEASAYALAMLSLGLPAYILIKLLTPGFHARGDTRTPVRIALVAMLVNLAGNLALIGAMGVGGLALSTSVAAWVNGFMLFAVLHRRGDLNLDDRLRRTAMRLMLATAIMAAALLGVGYLVSDWPIGNWPQRIAMLATVVAAGGTVYAAACWALGAVSLADVRAQIRR